MKSRSKRARIALAGLLAVGAPFVTAADPRPNFLVIVADDLGFSDVGAFGGEIDTPNLDTLAYSGLRLTGFHSAPTCSPTRSMLMSGSDNHVAGLGSMAELLAPNQQGQPGFEGYLRPDIAALPERLRDAGYATMMAGKWHLGTTPETDPSRRGFEYSFALLQGGHNHFGLGLSTDPSKGGYTYRRNGTTLDALPADFYSSDAFTDELLRFLSDSSGNGKPFFAYLAFTAPHWPMQAPPSDIAKYRGRYDSGFDELREERLRRQVELGLLDASVVAHATTLKSGVWNDLSADQRAEQARLMEVYAAMVDRLDRNVGRVVDYLKRTNQFDNTVILFIADNGAEGIDLRAGTIPRMRQLVDAADNRLDNLGSATSYIGYGPGWAQAATAPSWLYKAYTTEGGTRVPAFIEFPGLKRQHAVSSAFGTVADVLPTLVELAGLPPPTTTFEGRTVRPVRGTSWRSYLTGATDRVHPPSESVGWELFGARALRAGDWKAVHLFDGDWQLFDLARDPGETRDLSGAEPKRLSRLVSEWNRYAKDVGVILPSEALYRP
jgi:arylsulfatase